MMDLLARILDDPDDAATRLVYADAIAATDPARGELIVVEEQMRDATGAERIALLQRRLVILEAHTDRWWPELPEAQLTTRGGFVRGVRAERYADVAAAERLARHEPITRLTIVSHAAIPEASVLARIRELELCGALPISDLDRWGEHVHHTLDLLSIRIFAMGGPPVSRLPPARRLSLAGCRTELPTLLVGVQNWTDLEELDLAQSTLTDFDLLVLMRRELPKLRRLTLGGNDLRTRGLLALTAALPRLPALETIDLVDARLPADETAALSALVDACGSRVRVVRAAPAPTAVTFELFNRYFEISVDVDGHHHVLVDGIERPFIFRDARDDYETKTYGRTAPLAPFARGLALGSPIMWSTSLANQPSAQLWPARDLRYEIAFHHDQLVITQRR